MSAAEIGAAQRHPRERDRREVRPARQAHRGRRTSTSATSPSRPARALLEEHGSRPGVDRRASSTTARPGRTTRSGRRRRGSRTGSAATNAFAVEYDNVSMRHAGGAARRARLLRAEPELGNVLLVAACRESYLLDYANERSRFMFNFGDGAVAGLLDGGRRPQRAARLARDHRRLVLAAGEGARRRQRRAGSHASDGCRIPRRRRPGGDEGRARRGLAAELRRRRRGRARALGRDARGRRLPLRDPHEAVDARGARRARSASRSSAPPTSTTPAT